MRTRTEFRDRLLRMATPLERCFSPGRARVRLGPQEATYDCSELEAFARPLWGLAPLAAGGDAFAGWDRYREGLVNGTDPRHPEYWGDMADRDQRFVETAGLAFALTLAPGALWEPLSTAEKSRVAAWLQRVNAVRPYDNNWLFFRVLVNTALRRRGMPHDAARSTADLDRLDAFYLGDGWYEDGPRGHRDYYAAFGMHYYGLLYAAWGDDPVRGARFRERAALFARDFIHWFSCDGAAVPYGRSLTYRFAMGAFWGALAFAGVDAFPPGVLKGLLLRHLRDWMQRPIFNSDGLLTLGYAYPNPGMTEDYSAHGSPYWAWKAFLPLALPETHPFWQAVEEPLPALPENSRQDAPGLLFAHDGGHTFALAGGRASRARHGPQKYAKFCYSSHFGFSVPAADTGLENQAPDSALALSEDGTRWRVRTESRIFERKDLSLGSTWLPWPDVDISTWLILRLPWHVRVHRIRTARTLETVEGGFALEPGRGVSVIRELGGGRKAELLQAAPGTNLMAPLTGIPLLRGTCAPGEHWLACAVFARPGEAAREIDCPFVFRLTDLGFDVGDPGPFYLWPAES